MTSPFAHEQIPDHASAHGDLADLGVVGDYSEVQSALELERDFLTALVWAPPAQSVHIVTAIVGDADDRTANPQLADAIPLSSALFLAPRHELVFGAIVDLVDRGAPPTPRLVTLVAERLVECGEHARARATLVEIAAPHRPPLPGGVELPHLATEMIDAWYRRGYTALTARMMSVITEVSADDLAWHWQQLTAHQRTAQRRRHHVRGRLGQICKEQ